jgi:hypothetical protein
LVGSKAWKEAAGATRQGVLGCAIAATDALRKLGVSIGKHLDVAGTDREMRAKGWQKVPLDQAMKSGKLFVPVKLGHGGRHGHIGVGIGNHVWENSSSQRQLVSRDMSHSSLRHSNYAYIVPT